MTPPSMPPTRFVIGGHRGFGENLWIEGSPASARHAAVTPAVRENTIRSFCRAAELGVSFVEFDVQVTSDGVPVLWHDDDLELDESYDINGHVNGNGSGATPTIRRVAVKELSLQQFKNVVQLGTTNITGASTALVRHFRGAASRTYLADAPALPWACEQEDALPTLAEAFAAVPTYCGFNIEIKVPTPPDLLTPPEEVTRIVDAIWGVVDQWVGKVNPEGPAPGVLAMGGPTGAPAERSAFFSSFDPDVVVAMRAKLSAAGSECEVWYLSECGRSPHADARRTSVAAALEFAAGLGLSGVVVPAAVLLLDEGIVAAAAAGGLRVQTYGLDNNDPAGVERQRALGVAGVIVDDVIGLMMRVAGAAEPPATPSPPSYAAPAPADLVSAASHELESIEGGTALKSQA